MEIPLVEDTDKSRLDPINRHSPVPLYHQLALDLEHQIRQGKFNSVDKFPTDHELSEKYQLSRPTVRQALNKLVNQGLLVRERGRGTFIRPMAGSPIQQNKVIKHRRLGLVMPWGPGTFFSPLLEVIEESAHQAGFHTMLVNNREDADVEMAKVRELMTNGVDGLLWMCPSGGPNEAFARTVLKTVPVVVAIDRALMVPDMKINLVEADNLGGMKQVVKYLIAKGHRMIAFVRESLAVSSSEERPQGYMQALTEAGIPVTKEWLFSSRQRFYENGRLCGEKILASGIKFDAICCQADATAIGVVHYLNEKGVKVPQDMAVTGFNDESSGTIVRPQLTTARIDVPEMGRQAIKLLIEQLERLDRGKPVSAAQITVPVELVVRESA